MAIQLCVAPKDAVPVGTISLSSGVVKARARTSVLKLHPQDGPDRERVQDYIAQRYQQRFGAQIREWLPTLVSLELDGEVIAAAGFRSAADRLYLERYLGAPVERYLAQPSVGPPPRARIVEAGQFAAMRPGAGRLLVPLLAQYLKASGFDWAVTTVTSELHHLFSRMGLTPLLLARADPISLSEAERSAWGTYYEHDPIVIAGRLSQIIGQLEHL